MALSDNSAKCRILLASCRSIANKVQLNVKDFLAENSLIVMGGGTL